MRKVLIKNSVTGVIQLIATSILIFVSISFFNKILGSELYGLYATIALIGNLNIFTNLGISSALLILLSEKGKCAESDHNIIVATIFALALIIPTTIVGIAFKNFIIVNIFNVPSSLYDPAKNLYILLLLSNLMLFIGQIFTAILDSMQKMYLTNFYQLIYNIFYNLLIILSIFFFKDLTYIGISILVSSLIWISLICISSLKHWGKINFLGLEKSFFPLMKKQASLGSKVYLSSLVNLFYEPITKILISHYIGVKEVGFFDIALKMRNQIIGLINKASQPLLPYIANLKDKQKLIFLIHDLQQKIFFLVVPVVIATLFCTRPFIRLWIGTENDVIISNSAIMVISFYLLFSSTMIPQYLFLMSKGHAGKTILIQLTNTISNLIIILLIFKYFGYYSFLIAYVFAIVFSFMLMLYYQKNLLGSFIFSSFSQVTKLIGVFIVNVIIVYLINSMFSLSDIMKLIINPIIILTITFILYRVLWVVNLHDLERYLGENNKNLLFLKKLLKL